jgi:hypothetical protein
MRDDIERLINDGGRDAGARLADLENRVWTRISERHDQARMGQVRLAAVSLALVVGIANGGFMLLTPRPAPSEMRIFTVSAGLSPLASLDVRG